MRLTRRDQRFIDTLRDRLAGKLHVVIDDVEREYGRAGVARPGGERRVGMYVLHHLGGNARPGTWDWRSVWNFHTRTKKWNTGGYNATVDQEGHVTLVVPPSRMTYGAGTRWNPLTVHLVALADYQVHQPTEAMLESIYQWLTTCDDVLGYFPWRPHGAIRQTACPGAHLEPHVWTMTARGSLNPRPAHYRD